MNYRAYTYLCVLLLSLPLAVSAKNLYVSDKLVITLRSGQGNQFEIIKMLPSGIKLEVLEETDSGYTKVRTEENLEGWVRTQYLTDEPIAEAKLNSIQARLEKLEATNKQLRIELKTLKKDKRELDKAYSDLQKDHSQASKELTRVSEVAAKPLLLDQQNKELQENYARTNDKLTLLKQENQVLKDRSRRDWFVAGAGVVILGIIIGLVIPKFRIRKKDSWGGF